MRLFIKQSDIQGNTIQLKKEVAHHLTRVLRKKVGDRLDIVIDQSQCQTIEISDLTPTEFRFKHIKDKPTPKAPIQITIAQGLPKQDKFSELLRSCTELGVNGFIPLITQHVEPSVLQKSQKKKDRWEKVIQSAATQSQRITLPTLHAPLQLSDLAPLIASHDAAIVCWEDESKTTLKACLTKVTESTPEFQRILLIIGPEGGLSYDEVQTLIELGCTSVKLGDAILRTEHAGFMAAAQVFYHVQD